MDISEIFQDILGNSQACYNICCHAYIDEMLVGFHGRCRFMVYMASKPEKYGLKIFILADAHTNYLHNAYLYTGMGSDCVGLTAEEKKCQKQTQSILKLAKPIYGTNQNITADNYYFSSIELVSELKKTQINLCRNIEKKQKGDST